MTPNLDRVTELIRENVRRLTLDLRGLSVLTEAGSDYFAATPVVAALAGARRVTAVTKTTRYGTFEEIESLVKDLASRLGVANVIEVVTRENIRAPQEFDIVTNLAHLRPLDQKFLGQFDASRIVIPYMCEKWEYRVGDLDLEYCREKSIPVAGTNESHADVDAFSYCGVLAAKLLAERDFELRGGRYAVLSPDNFGHVIAAFLRSCGADIRMLTKLTPSNLVELRDREALIVADYTSESELVGANSVLPCLIRNLNPGLELILIAGIVDAKACIESGMGVHPELQLPAKRMSRTLAHVGPRPIIALHAAGLKVGELLSKRSDSDLLQRF